MTDQTNTPVDANEEEDNTSDILQQLLSAALNGEAPDTAPDGDDDGLSEIPDDQDITLDDAMNATKTALIMCVLGGPSDVANSLNVVGTYLQRQIDARDGVTDAD